MTRPTSALFEPPVDSWHRLSPRYANVVRLTRLIANVVGFGVLAAVSWFVFERPEVTAGVGAVGLAWTAWRILRAKAWVDAWGWAERNQDLCITRGLWNKQLTVVPYGRMQVVEVSAGPLMRWQGLASVQLVTASAQSNAVIHGLTFDDATALRDRMIELSDARGAGL